MYLAAIRVKSVFFSVQNISKCDQRVVIVKKFMIYIFALNYKKSQEYYAFENIINLKLCFFKEKSTSFQIQHVIERYFF